MSHNAFRFTAPAMVFIVSAVAAYGCSSQSSDEDPADKRVVPVEACNAAASWAEGQKYTQGQLVQYKQQVYECVQPHTSLATWEPDQVPALWKLVVCSNTGTPTTTSSSGGGGAPTTSSTSSGGGTTDPSGTTSSSSGGPVSSGGSRLVAYVNCMCGFGVGLNGGTCLANPDPNINHVKVWEDGGTSPITHYIISFLSFRGGEIQTDPGEIWANGGGSTSDFHLHPNLLAAMSSAHAHGKKVMLSLGGEVGSSGFVGWWSGLGGSSPDRVRNMRAKLVAVADRFAEQNGFRADGFDVDIELGGVYQYTSDKYIATRDLINAVPDDQLVAFVPQVGNGLCAAPSVGDPLPPPTVLGGQCQNPVNGDDSSWTLARLDRDCLKADGTPKLDYFGIQYYNAGQAECCGGGTDAASMTRSAVQNYINLANGWDASGDTTAASNPWHQWAFYPGPWAAFDGIRADRLVLGKPGCNGCAGSNFLDLGAMKQLVTQLDNRLDSTMGGILFWDLCRLFGNAGPQCVSGQCQPSWGGPDILTNLSSLKGQMDDLRTR